MDAGPGIPATTPRRTPRTRWQRLVGRLHLGWRRVLSLRDTPHRIALGSAIGTFTAWLPLLGVQIILAAGVAKLCRANVLATVPWAFITNPLTAVPFYYLHYRLGLLLLGGTPMDQEVFQLAWQRMTEGDGGWWSAVLDMGKELRQVIVPLVLGTVVIGAPAAFVVYRFVRMAVIRRRQRMRRRWRLTLEHDEA